MWLKDLFKENKKEKRNEKMEKFEHIKLKCKNCGETIEGDGKGTYISCSCGKVAVDEVKPYYTRIIGTEEDFEIVKEQSLYEEALEKCKNNEEMWVKIKGYEDYELSNLGACRRLHNGVYKSVGYLDKHENRIKLQFRKDGKIVKMTTLANMMGKVFEIPNPKNRKSVMSIDGNTMNCRLDNLIHSHNRDYIKCNDNKEIEYSDKDRIDKELSKPIETKEIWKDVIGYERWYEVSDKGNVRKINDDGTRKILKAKPSSKGRTVGLRTTSSVKTYQVSHLVADAFNLKPIEKNKTHIYHIDGDVNNDCFSNLTYDKTETEAYIKEQERIKEEQARIEQESHKEELVKYVEENKEFLKQAKEMNKEITIKDVYDKLCEILEVLKNDNR